MLSAAVERQCERSKVKRRVLAIINFIGELYNVEIVSRNIMHYCMTTLLDERSEPDEGKVGLLCKLLQSIGEKLDTPVRLRAASTPPLLSPIPAVCERALNTIAVTPVAALVL